MPARSFIHARQQVFDHTPQNDHGSTGSRCDRLFAPGVFAQHLDDTPPVEEGPFYPYHDMPLDMDNDLIIVGNSTTPAVGQITHLGGRILDSDGNPIKNALVEIWQCDSNGLYIAAEDKAPRRQKLSRLRTIYHRFRRRISLPNHKARPLQRPPRSRTFISKSNKPARNS